MQNQTNIKYSSNPKDVFKSAKSYKELLETTICKVLSKILNRNKTLKKQYNFCKDMISWEIRDM